MPRVAEALLVFRGWLVSEAGPGVHDPRKGSGVRLGNSGAVGAFAGFESSCHGYDGGSARFVLV